MLAMSYFRENSLRSIEDEHHDGQINESIWTNWDMSCRNQQDLHHHQHQHHHHQHNHVSHDTSFSAKGFDWEAGATNDNVACKPNKPAALPHWKTGMDPLPGAESHWKAAVEAPPSAPAPALAALPVEPKPFPLREDPIPPVAYVQEPNPKRRKTSTSSKKTLTPLPLDFEPLPYSILCGQGNEYFNAVGNRRFRVTVSMFLQRYQNAKDRQEKSAIVTTVMDILFEACPVGAFIKFRDGRWWAVDEKTAREKVGAHFRDSLAEKYKSSAKAKIAKRRDRERARRNSLASRSSQGTVSAASSVASSSKENL